VALIDLIPYIGIPMLIMTGAVSYDAHSRNKYAAPWFLLTSVIGLFGVLFYYVTIRTEEPVESPPTPSSVTKVLLPILSLVGAFCAFAGIIGVLNEGGLVASLYGFPAIAIGILLYYDYSFGDFERQKLFVECLYAFSLGGVLSIMLVDFINPFTSYYIGAAVIIPITVLFPLGWYAFRKNSDGRASVPAT